MHSNKRVPPFMTDTTELYPVDSGGISSFGFLSLIKFAVKGEKAISDLLKEDEFNIS